MEFLGQIADLFLHLDEHLTNVFTKYGVWTYGILFAIIFLETGVVVTPFLPGDSLLFAAGALSAAGGLNPLLLFAVLTAAAILGDSVNYSIGRAMGPRVFREDIRWLKREYLERTQQFYEKHGGKTIILARFVPIVRTFAPFVAGVGTMSYSRFVFFNVVGGVIWTGSLIFAGYFFGNLPVVREHFEVVVLGIVFVSVLPMAWELFVKRSLAAPGASSSE